MQLINKSKTSTIIIDISFSDGVKTTLSQRYVIPPEKMTDIDFDFKDIAPVDSHAPKRLSPRREKEIRETLKAFKYYREVARMSYQDEPANDIEELLHEIDALRESLHEDCKTECTARRWVRENGERNLSRPPQESL